MLIRPLGNELGQNRSEAVPIDLRHSHRDEFDPGSSFVTGHDFSRAETAPQDSRALAAEGCSTDPFLATCALGFRDPAVPTGLWSTPEPEKLCAVSGGYAYIIDTTTPDRFTMIPHRPVLAVHSLPARDLLLFVAHHAILAWGRNGQAWQSPKLSDEGVTITAIANNELRGLGWDMMADQEIPFTLDLKTGQPAS